MEIGNPTPSDIQPIMDLDRTLFPNPWLLRNVPNWYWKHKRNPNGEALIKIMKLGSELAAHFAVIPHKYKFFDETILASHSIAMMVKPEYQGKGIIKFVADKLFADCEQQGIAFSYGYPNGASYELHKKMFNYDDITTMEEYHCSIDRSESYQKASANLKLEPVARFGGEADNLWEKASQNFNIAVHRDSSFLNWRYLDRPDSRYYVFGAYENNTLVGYSVLKMFQDSEVVKGHFIDIMALPGRKDVLSFLTTEALHHFQQFGVNLVTSWIHGYKDCQEVFKEHGFTDGHNKRPWICRVNSKDEKFQKIYNGENWLFTMGDTTEIF